MAELSIGGHALLLSADTRVDMDFLNPKLSDAIQDDHSIPFDVPVRGNELVLGHVHQLALTKRDLVLGPAAFAHDGQPLFPGVVQVLGSNERTVRSSFSAEGFASVQKGVKLRTALGGNTIDTVATHGGLVQHAKAVTMVSTPHESHCFPLHVNKSLYGSANPQWQPSASAWSDSQAYAVDALVLWTEYTPVRRDWPYQCLEATTAGQSPESHASKWRRVVFGVVNSYDAAEEAYDENSAAGNFYAMVPFFRYDWILRTALKYLGLQARGDWFADHATPTLLLPNANPLDSEAPAEVWGAQQSTPATYGPTDYPVRLPLDNDSDPPYEDPADTYDTTARTFQLQSAGRHDFSVYVEATFSSADYLSVSIRRASDNSIVTGPGGMPGVFVGPNSSTSHAHLFQFTINFEPGDVGLDFYIHAEPWNQGPFMAEYTFANSHATVIRYSLDGINSFRNVIDPADHVPDMELGEFLQAVATTFGLEVLPDLERGVVEFNIKERVLRDAVPPGVLGRTRLERTTDISERQASAVDVDHQRRLKGVRMNWQLDSAEQTEPANSERRTVVDLESAVEQPNGPRQHCWVRSTRKLLRSVWAEAEGAYVWQHQGYLLPGQAVGETEGATELQLPIKPLAMDDVWVDGRRLLVPVLEQAGRSSFFATDAESTDLHVCHNYGPVPAGVDDAQYPAAGSWGMDAQATPRWSLLLAEQPEGPYPDYWDHYHNRWYSALVRALPVTMDLQVDMGFLLDRRKRNDILHINGGDHLLESMPLSFGRDRTPLVSADAYLRRLVPPALGAAQPKVYVPPVPSECGEAGHFSFTNSEMPGYLYVLSSSSHLSVRNVDTDDVVILEGELVPYVLGTDKYLFEIEADADQTYCCYPCDSEGIQGGEIVAIEGDGSIVLDDLIIGGLAATLEALSVGGGCVSPTWHPPALPVLRAYVRWYGGLTEPPDLSQLPLVGSVLETDDFPLGLELQENLIADVNPILLQLVAGGVEDGYVALLGDSMGAPSGDGITAANTLLSRNWLVAVNE